MCARALFVCVNEEGGVEWHHSNLVNHDGVCMYMGKEYVHHLCASYQRHVCARRMHVWARNMHVGVRANKNLTASIRREHTPDEGLAPGCGDACRRAIGVPSANSCELKTELGMRVCAGGPGPRRTS
jgi:hypothetical protein